MRIGLALPQYDYSVPGQRPLPFSTVLEHACRAEELGFASIWLSDHLFLDIAKYGGADDREGCFEPIVTLGALARLVPRVRLGTLVLLEALRPATVLAKSLATLDRVTGGRLDVGLGAGWYAPEYDALGMTMPSPGERLARLRETIDVVTGMLDGAPVTYDGTHQRALEAVPAPGPLQEPRPRVFVGGSGDRLLRLVARHADGWNTCWKWAPATYRERVEHLERECEACGRDPASVWRSLGLYALCGENEADLQRRYERLQAATPGVLDRTSLAEFRETRLVGTVEEVREQAHMWADLGVETLIVSAAAVPFQSVTLDDTEMLATALT
jgi:probable F420-dependent oxidoreductase